MYYLNSKRENVKKIDFYLDRVLILNKKRSIDGIDSNFFSLNIQNQFLIDYGLKIFDLDNNSWYDNRVLDYSYILWLNSKEILCKKVDDQAGELTYHKYQISEKEYCSVDSNIEGNPVLSIGDNNFICREQGELFFYKNFEKSRVVNLAKLAYSDFLGEHEGEIDSVHLAEDKIIVIAKVFVLALDVSNGEILWQTKLDFKPYHIAIEGGTGYLLKNHHYAVINLENGELELKKELDPIKLQGQDLRFDGYGTQYHKGLVWCCIKTHGYNFVAALYPENGDVVWLEHVETPDSLNPPKFHSGKMYILDGGGTLHIYQQEPKLT